MSVPVVALENPGLTPRVDNHIHVTPLRRLRSLWFVDPDNGKFS